MPLNSIFSFPFPAEVPSLTYLGNRVIMPRVRREKRRESGEEILFRPSRAHGGNEGSDLYELNSEGGDWIDGRWFETYAS